MNINTPGHSYELAASHAGDNHQTLKFVEQTLEHSKIKDPKTGQPASPPKLVVKTQGTKSTEVLQAVLDRLGFMYSRVSHIQVLLAAHHVELALLQLQTLEEGMKQQGVENPPVI